MKLIKWALILGATALLLNELSKDNTTKRPKPKTKPPKKPGKNFEALNPIDVEFTEVK